MSGTLAIPASFTVNVIPSTISAGGNALDLSGLLLTNNNRVPVNAVMSFPTQAASAAFFGPASQEAALATNYFLGFDNSNQKPGNILFTQYNQAPVGGWLRGGSVAGVTLSQLHAVNGVLTVSIDGTPHTSGAIDLSSATSFSAAAEIISQSLGVTGPAGASITAAIAATTLTVSLVSSGALAVGQEVRGAGVTAGTVIAAFLSGTGGTGTYTVTNSQTVSSEVMTTNVPTVTFDSVAGAFYVISPTTGVNSAVGFATGTIAQGLRLTQATGATISAGAVAAVPATFMAGVTAVSQNWASFATTFDPDNGSGNSVKQAFAAWTNGTVDQYVYVAWDTDITPTLGPSATSLGALLDASNSSGTIPIYSPAQGATIAAFIMGAIASVDFTELQGRATMKFRAQTGITPDVVNVTIAANLEANGYNYYGANATANDVFNYFAPGQISGPFNWIDSYINQIWMNNQFQLALMVLMTNVKSLPYNPVGYGMVRASLMDPISQAGDFGAFQPGVTLSQSQISQVNTAAGLKIDTTLSTQGWYLQIRDALPQVRSPGRGSPPMTFWYMDGESIQKLSLASVEVQ